MMRDYLWLHWRVLPGSPVAHQLAPLLHALARFLEERAVLALLEERDEHLERGLRIAGEASAHRESEPDARRIAVDLHGTGLLVLGIELHVGEARPDHEQRITFLHRELRRERTQ